MRRASNIGMHRRDNGGGLYRVMTVGIVVAALWFVGCGSAHQTVAKDVNNRAWAEEVVLTFENVDTAIERDLMLYLRCNSRFTADTLTLHLQMLSPDSLHFEEYMRFTTTPPARAAALPGEVLLPYRTRTTLAAEGNYRLTVTPTRAVRGVESVGLAVLKSE